MIKLKPKRLKLNNLWACAVFLIAACVSETGEAPQALRATIPVVASAQNVPFPANTAAPTIQTMVEATAVPTSMPPTDQPATATVTEHTPVVLPTLAATHTAVPSQTTTTETRETDIAPTEENTPRVMPSSTARVTPEPTLVAQAATATITGTPTSTATDGATLTPPPTLYINPTAEFTTPEGWSCGDFPCDDDVDGFLERIRVPVGYQLSHVGRFPGQPMQITYGPDGRLYATVLLNGSRIGAIFAMNQDGSTERYSGDFYSPVGLAFEPATGSLFVSARLTPEAGGGLWRIDPNGVMALVLDNLPCCFSSVDNQPNGMVFGSDGYLYLGVGGVSDHGEPEDPQHQAYAVLNPWEAAILRIEPNTLEVAPYAQGIRNPYDLTIAADGQIYATDNGMLTGPGDRVLKIDPGGHYGWPYYRLRGCEECPLRDATIDILPDFVPLPDYTLPRGITAYNGTQFPSNIQGSLFVTLWHNTSNAQRVIRIDPATVPDSPEALENYSPEPFITGLIRPVDVTVAPDGSLIVADFIYGHIWRVSYVGPPTPTPTPTNTLTATASPTPTITLTPTVTPTPTITPTSGASLFVTATPHDNG